MSFSEKQKLEVKKKAAFRCCRCHEIGIDVHHIVPQSDGGPDDIENAAPLCQNCHDRFGANSEKRKEIKQMRDWWYEVVKEKYSGDQEKWQRINELILQIQSKQYEQSAEVQLLRGMLEGELKSVKESIGSVQQSAPSELQHKTNEYISAARLGKNVYADFHCSNCGTTVGLLAGTSTCPGCKQPIE